MTDDWSWFWTSDRQRTYYLRDELESLRVVSSSASAESSRLSSQLQTLQGSIETRLDALSVAFDAYVELGDVREQLAGYPDSSAVRRDALRAVEALSRGASAERVDDRGLGYWLSGAVNALIDVVSGVAAASGGAPSTTGPEAELFVVAAAGALGHGERVAHRVAPLLVTDATLTPRQLVLWAAVRDGVFGPVLDEVATVWSPSLVTDPESWSGWVRDRAKPASSVDALRWIDLFLRGDAETSAPTPTAAPAVAAASGAAADGRDQPPADPRLDPLRGLVRELIDSGVGDEQALLARSRVLRARIENPGAAPADTDQTVATGPTVTDVVRQSVLDCSADAGVRRTLTGWVRPALLGAARSFDQDVARPKPDTVAVHTGMGEFTVGVDGVEPADWQQADAQLEHARAVPASRVTAPAVVAGVLATLGVILFAAQVTWLGVLLLVGAVVAGVVTVRGVLERRGQRESLATTRQAAQASIDDGRRSAQAVRQARLTDQGEAATLMRSIDAEPAVTASTAGPR